MKRLVALVMVLVLALSISSFAAAEAKDFGGAELVIATWGFMEAKLQKLAADFAEKYNCKIVIDPTAGNGPRLNKLEAEAADPTADIAMLSTSFAATGIAKDLFEKLDPAVVTSTENLFDFAKDANGYGPCYSLCRYGIMYDAAALKEAGLEAPASYQDLFKDEYAGMVILPDMSSTAGPYMLVAMAEAMGGSQENVAPAMQLMQEKKDNIVQWYTTTADVLTAFTTGEACITVFMDINMADLINSGLEMVWVDASEGSFAAPASIEVVKNAKNAELAQLFVEFMICDETQNKVAEVLGEAPVNKNASVPAELAVYLANGEESMNALKAFDEDYISTAKEAWIEEFQRTVAVQ